MSSSLLLITCVAEDVSIAEWLKRELRAEGFSADSVLRSSVRMTSNPLDAIRDLLALIVLVSPDSKDAHAIYQDVRSAQDAGCPIIPIMVRDTSPIPVYLVPTDVRDFTQDAHQKLNKLVQELPKPSPGITFQEASDRYLNRASLKSSHTIDAYRRAIELFLDFLDKNTRSNSLPVFAKVKEHVNAASTPLDVLADGDAPDLVAFRRMDALPRKASRYRQPSLQNLYGCPQNFRHPKLAALSRRSRSTSRYIQPDKSQAYRGETKCDPRRARTDRRNRQNILKNSSTTTTNNRYPRR